MSISLLSFLLICSAQLLLALIVLLKNRKGLTNISFFAFTLSIIVWIISNYFIDKVTDKDSALIIMRIIFIASGLAPYTLLLFSLSLTKFGKKLSIKRIVALTILPLVSLLFCLNDFVIQDIKVQDGVWGVDFGALSIVYNVYLVGYFFAALIVLFGGFRRARGIEKIKFQYVFAGLALTVVTGVVANLLLPLFNNNFNYVVYGPYATIFTTGLISFSILRHKLFDIRPVIARSVAYVLSVVAIATIYVIVAVQLTSKLFGTTNISPAQQIFNVVLAVILAFTFHPLRRFFEKITDKIFYRDKYDPQVVINSMGRILASEIRLDVLVREVTRELAAQLRLSSVDIVVVNEKSIYFQGQVTTAKNVQYKLADLKKLSRSQIVSDDLSGGERKDIMDKYNIGVSLAMRTSEAFVGYLLLGNKLSGDIYNDTDLKVLRIIADELAIAIQNAKSYAEIERFNETLQAKIDLATEKLRVANANLKELDKAKDEFISMASHQLRTPLTTAKGYISMVLDGDFGRVDKSQLEPLGQALDSANRMAGLVSDLLNVSRMDAGKFFIDTRETDMVELVQGEFNGLKSMAASKNVRLSYAPPQQKIAPLSLDEDKTRQVVMNLIDNAIHYSAPPAGGGRVDVSFERDGQEVVFKVVDNGIGVPQKMQDKLFTKFYRATNAQATRPDGTGLGLYLVKRVVEDQGGELIFESTEGEGSTFGFRMPIKSKPKSGTVKT